MASSIECNMASSTTECQSELSPPIVPDVASLGHHSRSSSPNSSCTTSSSTARPNKRKRLDTFDDPGSVQSDSSISQPSAPKRRGRPPKTHSTPVSPSQLENMNESDVRYFTMRNKNNEASRRSRINRKDREQQIEDEAVHLEEEHSRLVAHERRLEQRCMRFKELLLQMAAH